MTNNDVGCGNFWCRGATCGHMPEGTTIAYTVVYKSPDPEEEEAIAKAHKHREQRRRSREGTRPAKGPSVTNPPRDRKPARRVEARAGRSGRT